MHTLDQAVGRHHDLLARRRLPDSGVVADPELKIGRRPYLCRKRRGKELDQCELADVANMTVVGHQSASRWPLHERARFLGLVA
jgi:hypothetical protein